MLWLIDLVLQSLVWRYIEMFTGGDSIARIVQDINCIEAVYSLTPTYTGNSGNEDGEWRLPLLHQAFRKGIHFLREGVGDGTELNSLIHLLISPRVLRCAHSTSRFVLWPHACATADVFNSLFQHDPDIIGPITRSYALSTSPSDDNFVIPYLQRRLFEEQSGLM